MTGSGLVRALVIEVFDLAPSLAAAAEVFAAAGVPFALAGQLAIWVWVPGSRQGFAKVVEFAVRAVDMPAIDVALVAAGYEVLPLSRGGAAIRVGATRVNFIDRRVEFVALFTAAVDAAQRGSGTTIPDGRVFPVVPPDFLIAMKLATGDPRDERDVERLLDAGTDYDLARATVRTHLGPAVANRLDHIGARVGRAEAARYVRGSSPAAE